MPGGDPALGPPMISENSEADAWPPPGSAGVLWEALVHDAAVKVAVIDSGGTVLYANRAFARSFAGSSPASVAGRSLPDFLPDGFAQERVGLVRRTIEGGRPVRLKSAWRGVQHDVFMRALPQPVRGRIAVLVTISCEPGAEPPDSGGARVVKARHVDEGPLAKLSPRERTVLSLIGAGMPTARIARTLGRSAKTIENQRLSLGRKLGAKNRVELARIAIQSGMVGRTTGPPPRGAARRRK